MQAGGFTWAMLPLLKKIYKDDKAGLSAAMKDNLEFINTHPNLVGFLMGLLISMEENKEDRSTIKGLKVSLFGPIAGIGDAIFWFTLLPIMAGICSFFASQGNLLGPILFFAVYLGGILPARRLDTYRLYAGRQSDHHSTLTPASLLWLHEKLTCLVDGSIVR